MLPVWKRKAVIGEGGTINSGGKFSEDGWRRELSPNTGKHSKKNLLIIQKIQEKE